MNAHHSAAAGHETQIRDAATSSGAAPTIALVSIPGGAH
jgi:hypothetical protein